MDQNKFIQYIYDTFHFGLITQAKTFPNIRVLTPYGNGCMA